MPARRRFLIVTADDYGLHEHVNAAVDAAHREGILTAASLMVGAPAAADAVRRARELPALRVGLHLVLADGAATLPRASIPLLVDARGRFGSRMALDGVRYFALRTVRRQLEAEISAQFRAFERSGLTLDHVNAHKHFHLHPTLLEMLLRIGRDFGLKAVRLPAEPEWFAARMGGGGRLGRILLRPWIGLLRRRLQAAGITCNDHLFGLSASGAMDEAALLAIVARLPPGISEIYLHPATSSGGAIAASMARYRHADELAALRSERVQALLAAQEITRGGFRDIDPALDRRPAL